jgi:hypothetical protein
MTVEFVKDMARIDAAEADLLEGYGEHAAPNLRHIAAVLDEIYCVRTSPEMAMDAFALLELNRARAKHTDRNEASRCVMRSRALFEVTKMLSERFEAIDEVFRNEDI